MLIERIKRALRLRLLRRREQQLKEAVRYGTELVNDNKEQLAATIAELRRVKAKRASLESPQQLLREAMGGPYRRVKMNQKTVCTL